MSESKLEIGPYEYGEKLEITNYPKDYKKPKYKIGDVVVAKGKEDYTPFLQMIIKDSYFREGEWIYCEEEAYGNEVSESQIIEKL